MKKSYNCESFYKKDFYFYKNPQLHIRDSLWKVKQILPYIDGLLSFIDKKTLNILDVGGGTGIILKKIGIYIKTNYQISINKYLLDLSPKILEVQKKNNQDYTLAINKNIKYTGIKRKKIDITLMIDVLEHVPNPNIALKEISKISDFAIFKIPLQKNLFFYVENFLRRGKLKKLAITSVGHINFYNPSLLFRNIKKNCGKVIDFHFTNVHNYSFKSPYYFNKRSIFGRAVDLFFSLIYHISPHLASLLGGDYIMILVNCY